MSIKVKCEECGVALKIKDELAGKKGNCPQCKAPLHIPALDGSQSDAASEGAPPEEFSEEDAIFGRGFFDAEAPARPRTLDLSSDPDDEKEASAPAPAEEKPKKKKKKSGFTAAKPDTTENAADIAGSLLTKTGKKNRPDDIEEEDNDKVEYDFSEINYLLKTRVLPSVGAIIAAFLLYLWLSSSESNLPTLAEVSGRVTLDGNPFPAQLVFFPSNDNSEGSGSLGQCNPDGTYEVYYNADVKGAIVGPNTVRITAGAHSFVETRDVTDGPNQLDFDLKTQ
jgi:hypothetical protein